MHNNKATTPPTTADALTKAETCPVLCSTLATAFHSPQSFKVNHIYYEPRSVYRCKTRVHNTRVTDWDHVRCVHKRQRAGRPAALGGKNQRSFTVDGPSWIMLLSLASGYSNVKLQTSESDAATGWWCFWQQTTETRTHIFPRYVFNIIYTVASANVCYVIATMFWRVASWRARYTHAKTATLYR